MTVIDFVQLTRRSWRALVIFVLLGCAAMAGYTYLQPKVYEASSAGFIAAGNGTSYDGAISGSQTAVARAQAYVPLISTTPVFDKIAQDPSVDLQGQPLAGRLSASVATGSTMIVVSATASNPESALALANGALKALAAVINDIETKASSGQPPAIKVVPLETAVKPTVPISPDWKVNLGLGAIGGLILGYLFIFVRRGLDARIRSTDDLPQLMGAGLLGNIPKVSKRKLSINSDDRDNRLAAESIRQVRTGLSFASVDRKVHSMAVTSANQSEGKTTIATSLAQVFAQSGRRTLIIDADLRRPAVSEELGIDESVGLSELLSGQVSVTQAIRPTDNPELFVLPAGRTPPNPSEMLGSAAFRTLVEEMTHDHFVIIDAPPLLPVTDAALVSVVVDGVVFVAAAGKTRKPEIAAARRILEQVHARTLGLVLNMVPLRGSESSYYEYYGRKRGYYYHRSAEAGHRSRKGSRRAKRRTA